MSPQLIVTVCVVDPDDPLVVRTLRVDFDGERFVAGNDPSHQIVDELEFDRPEGPATRQRAARRRPRSALSAVDAPAPHALPATRGAPRRRARPGPQRPDHGRPRGTPRRVDTRGPRPPNR